MSQDVERIKVQCPACRQQIRLPPHRTGTVKCPHCGKPFSADTRTKITIGGLYFAPLEEAAQYFTFYDDGTLISVMSDGAPAEVARWFTRQHREVSPGRFAVTGEEIEIWLPGRKATAHYRGEITPYTLELHIDLPDGKEYVPAFLAAGVGGQGPAGSDIRTLIEDLVAAGRKASPDRRSSSHFLEDARERAEKIGADLDQRGGLGLMQAAHAEVLLRLGRIPARELEAAWGGIGEWMS